MKNLFRKYLILLLVLSNQALFSQAATPGPTLQAQSGPQDVGKIDQLLKQSGYKYNKAAEGAWLVEPKGKTYRALIGSADDVIVIGVVLLKKEEMPVSQDFLLKLLKLNHDFDYVKIGLDGDGDLFSRTEHNIKGLTLEDFK